MNRTIRGRLGLAFSMAVAMVLLAAPSFAQTGLATVKGTVQDATGAVVPGAALTLTNDQTNIARKTVSSSVGSFEFPSAPIGSYKLAVEITGFKKWEGTFELQAGQTVVIDPALDVGSVETVVEVTGAAPVITTEGMAISDVKDETRIRQLPLNGRAVTNLFTLTPGVEGGGSPRVNGMKVGSTEMLMDGISLVDRFGGGMARVQPGLDTVQEFRIETNGSDARYSRPSTVALVTKSGTNQFHGTAFETHRNNFGGLRARTRQDGNEAAQLVRNEFGISAGGPIIRNKTFIFGAYEGNRERSSRFATTAAPTPAMWNGDMSEFIDTAGDQTFVYDPLSTGADGRRTLFPNLLIPQNRLSGFSKKMHAISPDPTSGVNPYQGNNFTGYYPNITDFNLFTVKGDHNFSEKDTMSIRFTEDKARNALQGGRFGYPKPGCDNCGGSGRTDATVYNGMGRWNHVFSPTLLNEFQLSMHRSVKSSGTLGDNTSWADDLGLPNPFAVTGWPTLCADSPFFYYGCWDGDNRKDENLSGYQLDNNVTWIKGKHSIAAGVKVRYEYNNVRELQQAQGSHDFGGTWTSQFDPAGEQAESFTGSGFASLLLGNPTFLSNQANRGFFYFEQQEYGAYIQDTWRVTPRLTLNLGVRWDMWTAYEEKYNRLTSVNVDTLGSVFQAITPKDIPIEQIPGLLPSILDSWKARGLTFTTADKAGFPSGLFPGDHNNFGPRISAAFKLTDKTVLRGGYGEFFWTMPLSQILQTSRTNPPFNLRFVNNLDNRNGADDFYSLSNAPAPTDYVGMAVVPINGLAGISSRAQSVFVVDPHNWSDDRAQTWNFSIEREILKNTAVRLSYIGTHGRDLEQRYSVNAREAEYNYQARTGLQVPGNPDERRINKDWGVTAANNSGISTTTSLQAEVERRYSNGLGFQWFYTFTHSLTTSDAGGFTSGNGAINASGTGTFQVPENIELLGAPNLSYSERLQLGRINSGNIPAQRITWNAIYDLPFGKGKKFGSGASGWLDKFIGGWQLATIGSWRSGNWLSVNSGRYLFGDPTLDDSERLELTLAGQRRRLFFAGDFDPTQASNVDQAALQRLVPLDRSQRLVRPLGASFNNRLPQQLANGTVRQTSITDTVNWSARNFFRGPGDWNLDLSVFKTIRITERINTRFQADFFNSMNHPNDLNPDSVTGLQDLSRQTNDPRIIQFTLRVNW